MSDHASPQECSRCNPLECVCECHKTTVTPPAACGATEDHAVMRGREHLSVCPICNVDLTSVFPPEASDA